MVGIKNYLTLMRLFRPIGIYLLLWPVLWALWFAADGFPNPQVLFIFVIGVVLMRSAGCVINDYADRKIDPLVARTRNRPIASGRVSPKEAIAVFVVLIILAFLLVLQTNLLTVYMAVIALFWVVSYPFMKRIHSLPQVHLGLAFGWAIPMAYAAQSNVLPPLEAWLLYAANICWTVAYDTMYAMADRHDDKVAGVKSSALLFGNYDRLIIAAFQLSSLILLFIAGYLKMLGGFYYGGLAVAAVFSVYQQYLIRNRYPQSCLRAFNNNNYFGMAVFGGLLIDLLA
ncbi:MAG: 4-hydroxybenzoate octaprenyltransferase [Gammaproteobacteria bacterium]|nr:4-hydroxybenzoate octaprenyltransferase [Gammaproteobacteria bacterium]